MSPLTLAPPLATPPGPEIENLLAWSFDQTLAAASGNVLTTGLVGLSRIMVPQTLLVTNILCRLEAVGTSLTSNESFAGIYDSSFNRLGQTADQSVAWAASTGTKTMAISGGAITIPGGPGVYIYGALLNVSTGTAVSFQKAPSNDPNGGQATPGSNLRACRTTSAVTALPNPIATPSALVSTFHYWIGLS